MFRICLVTVFVSLVDCCCLDNRNATTPLAVVSSCGHSKYYHATDNASSGILGGSAAKINEFPWIVKLTDEYGHFFCAASIIDEYWLLTAAHCYFNESDGSMFAIFGDHKDNITEDSQFSMQIDQGASVVHPNYDPIEDDCDLALLRLPRPLTFDNWTVQKVCLPSDCNDGCSSDGEPAYIHGWGSVDVEGYYYPNTLQKAILYILDQAQCKRIYQGRAIYTDNMMCAAVKGGGIDSCFGDSGGPLVINEDGYFKVCGVTSWGIECGSAKYPGAYAKVCVALTWINEHISIGN